MFEQKGAWAQKAEGPAASMQRAVPRWASLSGHPQSGIGNMIALATAAAGCTEVDRVANVPSMHSAASTTVAAFVKDVGPMSALADMEWNRS